jgi:hypothetical protein
MKQNRGALTSLAVFLGVAAGIFILVAIMIRVVDKDLSKIGNMDQQNSSITQEEKKEINKVLENTKDFSGVVDMVLRPKGTSAVILSVDAQVLEKSSREDTSMLTQTNPNQTFEDKTFLLTVNKFTELEGTALEDLKGNEMVRVALYENIYDAPDYATVKSLTVYPRTNPTNE